MRVLISDLDGTLVYVPVKWSEVKEALSRILGSEVMSIFEVLRWARAKSEDLYRELSGLIEEYEVNSMRELRRLEGSRELLKRLKEFDVKIAIVTLQGERSLKKALEVSDLAPYVDAYVTRDEELDRAKQIEIALKKLDAEIGRDSIVFMGDRASDLEAGMKLRIPTVIIGLTVSSPLEAMNTIAEVLGLPLKESRK
ncbi:MAG: HAD-IA family hydrolase [Candidatus Nezhaarchaeota archaeon]|nr:HAD-IA family hydrolase [Candidatus Nezhaarchaeota archaeon]